MKKLLLIVLVPIFAVSLAFTAEPVSVQQKTENAGEATQIKNQEKTRLRDHKQNRRKQMKQIRQQNAAHTGTKAGN